MKETDSGIFNFFLLFAGLLLGVFLGGSFVYWIYDRQNDMLIQNKINQARSLFSDYPEPTQQTISIHNQTLQATADAYHTDSNQHPLRTGERNSFTPRGTHKFDPEIGANPPGGIIDTLVPGTGMQSHIDHKSATMDAIITDGALSDKSESPNIIIESDQLLATREISFPLEIDRRSLSVNYGDSLLGNPNKPPAEQIFKVEFWESPLNSFGYRMSKNKIALYGIRLFDFVSFIRYKGQIYLKYLNDFYPLELTNVFRPLIPTTDTYLIDQLR